MDELNPFSAGPQREAFADLLLAVVPAPDVTRSIRHFAESYRSWVEGICASSLEEEEKGVLIELAGIMLTRSVERFTVLPMPD